MSINTTVLIIGATSGIGAGLARRIHAQGKTVIATGRRQERLDTLQAELPGLQTACFDISDISSLRSHVTALTTKYPTLDTVIISAAIQSCFFLKDADSSTPESIAQEVTTNLTAPIVLCQQLVPYFLKTQKPCSIVFFSSGFAFIPVPFFPVYCPTKAGLQSFAVALRAQLAGTNISVTDVSPPYVATELDVAHKERLVEILGGPEKAIPPVPLEDFLDQAMRGLGERGEDGKPRREVAVGAFSEMVNKAWRTAFGPVLEKFHVDG
jgi:short-subunit dehydrogenase involved in D-alanine esterification of teichoic acids